MVTPSQDVRFEASSVERLSRKWAFEHTTDIPPDADVTLDQVHCGPEMSPKVTKLKFVNATPRQWESEKSEYPGKYLLIELLFNSIVPLGAKISFPYVKLAPSFVPQNTFIVLGL